MGKAQEDRKKMTTMNYKAAGKPMDAPNEVG